MVINQDFKEFIRLLNQNNVKYLVVGGYAVAFHGHPRYTKDLDLWIWINEINAVNLIKSLKEFGFQSLDLKPEDFLKPGYIIQLGHPPNRIDLITEVQGVDFDICFESRIETEIEGVMISFIDLENLKKNKKAVGRHQDLADIENLE
ncbi:MAG: nucleotidyltransferase [Proteobacteria bacterium]|nr:nucleotidyltransferase [Pseudomonadota bacterium]